MSSREPERRSDRPLTDRELQLGERILSDPFSWPPEFMQSIRKRLEQEPPYLTADDIFSFDRAALAAAPAIPNVVLALDASAANTDLPRPAAPHAYYLLGPGGGTIRSIEEPTWEGARVSLKNDSFSNITLEHNDTSGGASDRPLFFRELANVVLKPGESIELAYVDTFWQDVARSAGTATTRESAQGFTAAQATGAGAGLALVLVTSVPWEDWNAFTVGSGRVDIDGAGRYRISTSFQWTNQTGAVGWSYGRLRHFDSGGVAQEDAFGGMYQLNLGFPVEMVKNCAAGDYFEIGAASNAGAAGGNVYARTTIEKLF